MPTTTAPDTSTAPAAVTPVPGLPAGVTVEQVAAAVQALMISQLAPAAPGDGAPDATAPAAADAAATDAAAPADTRGTTTAPARTRSPLLTRSAATISVLGVAALLAALLALMAGAWYHTDPGYTVDGAGKQVCVTLSYGRPCVTFDVPASSTGFDADTPAATIPGTQPTPAGGPPARIAGQPAFLALALAALALAALALRARSTDLAAAATAAAWTAHAQLDATLAAAGRPGTLPTAAPGQATAILLLVTALTAYAAWAAHRDGSRWVIPGWISRKVTGSAAMSLMGRMLHSAADRATRAADDGH